MERWTFDLNRIRKNWERGAAPPEVTAEKICPSCGAQLPRGGSSPEKIAPASAGSASPRGTAGKIAEAATGSDLLDLLDSPRAMPSRFARVEAPRDPYPDAETLLVRVRGLVQRELAAHEPIVRPFLDEVAEILRLLAAKPEEGESPPVDRKKLRADLDRAIGDLEDMIALWSGIGR